MPLAWPLTPVPAPSPPTPTAAPQSTATPTATLDALLTTARRWAHILRAWYGEQSELASGSFVVLGHPQWNIGQRLVTVDERGEWEFYIEGVTHQYDFKTGSFISQLRVTRGWYLDQTVEDRAAGPPPVQGVSGGPAAFHEEESREGIVDVIIRLPSGETRAVEERIFTCVPLLLHRLFSEAPIVEKAF